MKYLGLLKKKYKCSTFKLLKYGRMIAFRYEVRFFIFNKVELHEIFQNVKFEI